MAHPELNELLNALLDMAETLLKQQGEFLPIGAIITCDGELGHVGGQVKGDEHPGSQVLIDLLSDWFRQQAAEGRLRAAGLCYDVLTVPPGKQQKQDAMLCALEHFLGEAVNVCKPYAKTEDGDFRFEEVFATERAPQFFGDLPRA